MQIEMCAIYASNLGSLEKCLNLNPLDISYQEMPSISVVMYFFSNWRFVVFSFCVLLGDAQSI